MKNDNEMYLNDPTIQFREDGPPAEITFVLNDVPLITIHEDGTISRGPAFTTNEEASLHFWEIVSHYFPQWRGYDEQRKQ